MAVLVVPRGGIEPPTQGFSVIQEMEQGDYLKNLAQALISSLCEEGGIRLRGN